MSAKMLLTIYAVIAVVFGLAFVLVPARTGLIYGVPPDAHTALALRFFGSALIGLAVVYWFAKDFPNWEAVRGVLIASVVSDVVGVVVNLFGTFRGYLNGMAWSTTLIYALLLIGSLYCLLARAEARGMTVKPAR
jgi:hypothetical protein